MELQIADYKIMVDNESISFTQKAQDVFNTAYFTTVHSINKQQPNGILDPLIIKLIDRIIELEA